MDRSLKHRPNTLHYSTLQHKSCNCQSTALASSCCSASLASRCVSDTWQSNLVLLLQYHAASIVAYCLCWHTCEVMLIRLCACQQVLVRKSQTPWSFWPRGLGPAGLYTQNESMSCQKGASCYLLNSGLTCNTSAITQPGFIYFCHGGSGISACGIIKMALLLLQIL